MAKNLLVNGKNNITARANAMWNIQNNMANRTTASNVNTTPNLPTPTRPTTINLQKAQTPINTKLNNLNTATMPIQNNNLQLQATWVGNMATMPEQSRFIGFRQQQWQLMPQARPAMFVPTAVGNATKSNKEEEQRYKKEENLIKRFHYAVKNHNWQMTANDIKKEFKEWKWLEDAALQLQADIRPLVQQGQFADMNQISEYYWDLLKGKELQDINQVKQDIEVDNAKFQQAEKFIDKALKTNWTSLSTDWMKYVRDFNILSEAKNKAKQERHIVWWKSDVEILNYLVEQNPELKKVKDEMENLQLTETDKGIIWAEWAKISKAILSSISQWLIGLAQDGEATKPTTEEIESVMKGKEKLGNEFWKQTGNKIAAEIGVSLDSLEKFIYRTKKDAENAVLSNATSLFKTVLPKSYWEKWLWVNLTDEQYNNLVDMYDKVTRPWYEQQIAKNQQYVKDYIESVNKDYESRKAKYLDPDVENYANRQWMTQALLAWDLWTFAYKWAWSAAENVDNIAILAAWIVAPEVVLPALAADSYARESQESFEELSKIPWVSYEQAQEWSVYVWLASSAVETVLEKALGWVETTASKTFHDMFMKEFTQNASEMMAKKWLLDILKSWATTQFRSSLEEWLEEVLQQTIHNASIQQYDPDQKLTEWLLEAFEWWFYNPMNLMAGWWDILSNVDTEAVKQKVKQTAKDFNEWINDMLWNRVSTQDLKNTANNIKNTANAVTNKAKNIANRIEIAPWKVGEVFDSMKNKVTSQGKTETKQEQQQAEWVNTPSNNDQNLNWDNYSQKIKNNKRLNAYQLNRIQNDNRMNPKQIQDFKDRWGMDYWQAMADRWYTESHESNVPKMEEDKRDIYNKKKEALNSIEWRFQDRSIDDMLEMMLDRAEKTKNYEMLEKYQKLDQKNKEWWLTTKEINDMREEFTYRIKVGFFKDNNSEKIELADNVYTAVRKFLEKTAEANGISDLREMNNEIAMRQFLIDGISQKADRSSANNVLWLNDIIILAESASNPYALLALWGKKIMETPTFKNARLNLEIWRRENRDIDIQNRKAAAKQRMEAVESANEWKRLQEELSIPETPALPNWIKLTRVTEINNPKNKVTSKKKNTKKSESSKKSDSSSNDNTTPPSWWTPTGWTPTTDNWTSWGTPTASNPTDNAKNKVTNKKADDKKAAKERILDAKKQNAEKSYKKLNDRLADAWNRTNLSEETLDKIWNDVRKLANDIYEVEKRWWQVPAEMKTALTDTYNTLENNWVDLWYAEKWKVYIDVDELYDETEWIELIYELSPEAEEYYNNNWYYPSNANFEIKESLAPRATKKNTSWGISYLSRWSAVVYVSMPKETATKNVVTDKAKVTEKKTTPKQEENQTKKFTYDEYGQVMNKIWEVEKKINNKLDKQYEQERAEKMSRFEELRDKEDKTDAEWKELVKLQGELNNMSNKYDKLKEDELKKQAPELLQQKEELQQAFDRDWKTAMDKKMEEMEKPFNELRDEFRQKLRDELWIADDVILDEKYYNSLTPKQKETADRINKEFADKYEELRKRAAWEEIIPEIKKAVEKKQEKPKKKQTKKEEKEARARGLAKPDGNLIYSSWERKYVPSLKEWLIRLTKEEWEKKFKEQLWNAFRWWLEITVREDNESPYYDADRFFIYNPDREWIEEWEDRDIEELTINWDNIKEFEVYNDGDVDIIIDDPYIEWKEREIILDLKDFLNYSNMTRYIGKEHPRNLLWGSKNKVTSSAPIDTFEDLDFWTIKELKDRWDQAAIDLYEEMWIEDDALEELYKEMLIEENETPQRPSIFDEELETEKQLSENETAQIPTIFEEDLEQMNLRELEDNETPQTIEEEKTKIVDKDGNPLRVYHWTNMEWDEYGDIRTEPWYWFTEDRDYAKTHSEKWIVREANLDMKNPINIDEQEEVVNWLLKDAFWDKAKRDDEHIFSKEFKNAAIKKWYDGLIFSHDDANTYIVFNKDQIIPLKPQNVVTDKANVTSKQVENEKPKNLVTSRIENTKQEIQEIDKDTYFDDIVKNLKDHPREMFIYKDWSYFYPHYILPSWKVLTPENTYWGEVSSEEAARNWLLKEAEEHTEANETKKAEKLKEIVGKTAEKYEATLKRIESDNPMQEIWTSWDYFKYGMGNNQMARAKKESEANAEVWTFKKDVIDWKEWYRIFVAWTKNEAIRAFYEPKTWKTYRIYRWPIIDDSKPYTTKQVERIEKFLQNVDKQLDKETKKEKKEEKQVITQEWLDSLKPDKDGVIELDYKWDERWALWKWKEALIKEWKADWKYLYNYWWAAHPQYMALYIKNGEVYEWRKGLEDQYMTTKQEAVDWLNQKEKDVEHESTERYTQTDYETLPKTISVETEAEKAWPKRIAPDRVKRQQETYDQWLENVKNVLKQSPVKIYELWFKSDRSKAVQDILAERRRIRELPETEAEKQWNELAKSVYEDLVIKDISKWYRYPEDVTSKFPKAQMKKAVDARARYEKGLFTSFSAKDTRANNQYRDEIWAWIKSQDWKPVTQEQMNEIVDGIRAYSEIFGIDMKKFAEDNNIIYVHLHGGNPFLMWGMNIGWLYRRDAAWNISVSLWWKEWVMEKWEDWEMKKTDIKTTTTHEITHAVDGMLDWKLFSNADIEILKKTMNKPKKLINYYNRPHEIVARAVEQYAAHKIGKTYYRRIIKNIDMDKGSVELGEKEYNYVDRQAYWDQENFDKYVKPIVEKNMKEKMKDYMLESTRKNVLANDKNKITSWKTMASRAYSPTIVMRLDKNGNPLRNSKNKVTTKKNAEAIRNPIIVEEIESDDPDSFKTSVENYSNDLLDLARNSWFEIESYGNDIIKKWLGILKKVNHIKWQVDKATEKEIKKVKNKLVQKYIRAIDKWIIQWTIKWTRDVDNKWTLASVVGVDIDLWEHGTAKVHIPVSLREVKNHKKDIVIIKKEKSE